jgi:hypothetical protein
MVSMRVGIVACEVFEREINLLIEGDEDIAFKEYVEFGEHVYPKKMKETLARKVNSLEGKVDSVFLGYGTCQSLKGLTESLLVPTVMLDVDDCIGALLTQAGYEAERKKCAGTWFSTPFFSDRTVERITKEMHLEKINNPKYDAMWFIRRFFDGYSRALYVDTGVGERESYESKSVDFAKLLNLRHESTKGTLDLLREGIEKAKALAREHASSNGK